MSDRLTKQDLREDALMTKTAQAADFASHHVRMLGVGILIFVVAAAGLLFYRSNTAATAEKSAALLTEAKLDLQTGALTSATSKLDDLINNYSGTDNGKQGLLVYGDVNYSQGLNAEAAEYYRRALDVFGGDTIFALAARRGLAASLENQALHGEAADQYSILAESAPNKIVAAELKLSMARNLRSAGRSEEARALYEELAGQTDNQRVAQEAKFRAAQLALAAG